MARPKRDADQAPESEPAATAEPESEASAAPVESKKIKIKAFKVYTSRGRRLAGDVDDFPADEADTLIANEEAEEWK